MRYDWPSLLTSVPTLISAAILLAASLHDITARTVPNWMAIALLLLGLAQRGLAGSLPSGLLAGFIIFAIAAFCWRRGWLGGGDVKLLAAASLVVPPVNVPGFICAVALAGGILATMYIAARRVITATAAPAALPGHSADRGIFRRALRAERWRIRRGGPLPYACAIAAGFLIVVLQDGIP
jgi:prepilin peptidase CpaA